MGLSLLVEVYHMVVQGKCFRAPHKVIPDGEAEASIFSGGHGKKRKEGKEALRSRFARSTILEEKWGTTRSLKRPLLAGNSQALQYAEKKFNTWESNLALHRRMRFCTADSVDVSFCPVMRCLSIMTCIPSGSVAEKKDQKNN